jgi:N6-L-threonylcarbamoyladenine synthase
MATDAPLILGFDTSAAACRVALTRGDAVLCSCEEEMAKGQAERLMVLCQESLGDHNLRPEDLDAVGVGTGPGNFTGVRISVAAARGMALGLGIPAIGVTAFDALRYGHKGACACTVDARRSGLYFQEFDASGQASAPQLLANGAPPALDKPLIGHGGQAPVHPMAVAICLTARLRLHAPAERPAPLYLRPADAAPSRNAPPVILS